MKPPPEPGDGRPLPSSRGRAGPPPGDGTGERDWQELLEAGRCMLRIRCGYLNPEDREDLLQEGVSLVWLMESRSGPAGNPEGMLWSVLRRLASNWIRKCRRRERVMFPLDEEIARRMAAPPQGSGEPREDEVPSRCRALLRLLKEGHSLRQAAKISGMSLASAHRALVALRRHLERDEDPENPENLRNAGGP